MASPPRTALVFQKDHASASLSHFDTTVTSVLTFSDLEEANRQLYKQGAPEDHVVITQGTIFHPQGGGQPSDEGVITSAGGASFAVAMVRMDAVRDGQVLHFGRFTDASFSTGDAVTQALDVEKRAYYSRLHTAGHVLGAAVRHLLENQVPGFDELKASHFPDSASCEFQGLIDGKWKGPIQERLESYVAGRHDVEIGWWDEEDFRARGLERLIPDRSLAPPGEKFRVVDIKGLETYPCGGTHVVRTDLCGAVTVKKVARSKGQSKVSYSVAK